MGFTQQASEWNEELLELRPFDIKAMEMQIDFELANNRLKSALAGAKDYLSKIRRIQSIGYA